VGGYLYVPTGSTESTGSFTGDGSTRVMPPLLFGGRDRVLQDVTPAYTAMGGVHERRYRNPSSNVYGGGVAAM
jgi:hypothetical protein